MTLLVSEGRDRGAKAGREGRDKNGNEQQGLAPLEGVILGAGGAGVTDLRVEEVENLDGYQLELHYDPAIVSAESLEPGPFVSPDWVLDEDIDNTTGVIAIAVSQRQPTPPRDGEGRLAQARWRGFSPGISALTLLDVKLAEPGGA